MAGERVSEIVKAKISDAGVAWHPPERALNVRQRHHTAVTIVAREYEGLVQCARPVFGEFLQ
jgi:hypothetical protein